MRLEPPGLAPLQAVVKVAHAPTTMVVLCHGTHNGTLEIVGPDLQRVMAAALLSPNTSNEVKDEVRNRVCGRPLLVVEAWSGDFFQPTIDLDTSDVTLDGQDIRSKLLVTLKYPKKLKQGEVFEKMKFTYQPPNPLAPGRHTLRVRLETPSFRETGIGQSEVTREFFVDRHIGDDRDDDDENDNERRRERDDD